MRRTIEVIRAAAWLGWQVEANWADPFLFIAYAIAKPLATTLMLFFMVRLVAPEQATADAFRFLFVGNTFFLYVSEVLIGISWAVFRDREDFETLKYVYAAPIRFMPYLIGRGMTKVAMASLGVLVTLIFGRFVLGLSLTGSPVALVQVLGVLALGLAAVLLLGIALAGAALVMARHSMNLNEGVSGTFFLLSGAVFPIDVLPGWAERLSLALPFTYWLELLRRLLTGGTYAGPLRGMSGEALLGVLAASTAVLGAASIAWFRWCERHARARGLIDWKTNY